MRILPAKKYYDTLQHLWYNYRNQEQGITYPFYASYKINLTCNIKCRFCNLWQEQDPGLPTNDVFKILDNIGKSSIFLLSMEGGDPLLRPDFMEILQYTRRQPFYLMITTSERNMGKNYPMREYCKYIDFLHISIDEGHVNMDMFDELEEYVAFGSSVCVQTVVTNKDIYRLDYKVRRCWEAGAKIVIMPAVHLEGTKDFFPEFEPDIKELEESSWTRTERTFTLALAYDGTEEDRAQKDAIRKNVPPAMPLTPEIENEYLWSGFLPDVDLCIRTGGEPHLSAGFLMHKMANAYLAFPKVCWPDFSPRHLKKITDEFRSRERRLGA